MFHVYLVNVRNGRESFQTNAVVELGRRFSLAPIDIRSLRHSRGHERLKKITQNKAILLKILHLPSKLTQNLLKIYTRFTKTSP